MSPTKMGDISKAPCTTRKPATPQLIRTGIREYTIRESKFFFFLFRALDKYTW